MFIFIDVLICKCSSIQMFILLLFNSLAGGTVDKPKAAGIGAPA
jgi:hypothetical protein